MSGGSTVAEQQIVWCSDSARPRIVMHDVSINVAALKVIGSHHNFTMWKS